MPITTVNLEAVKLGWGGAADKVAALKTLTGVVGRLLGTTNNFVKSSVNDAGQVTALWYAIIETEIGVTIYRVT